MWQDWLSQRRRKSPVAAAQQNPERPRSGNRQPLTLRLHAETAQTAGRLQTMSTDVDWSRQPSIYKLYPTVARLALTEQIDCDFPDTLEVVQRLSPHAALAAPAAWNLETLSRLCYYAYGPTAQQALPGATLTLRAAPSAGALYPAELYLALRGAAGARNGVYHYAPGEHALELLRPADWIAWLADAAAELPAVAEADAVFAISSLWWRTAWKYGPRAYRYCLQDCGHLAGNVILVAAALGYTATVVYNFVDEPVNRLVGLPSAQEAVQILVAIRADRAYRPPPRGAPDQPAPLALESLPPMQPDAAVDAILPAAGATALREPAAVQALRRCPAALVTETGHRQLQSPDQAPLLRPTAPVSLCQSLLGRRSSHQFKPAPLPGDALSAIIQALDVAYATDSAQGALELVMIVIRVEGVPEGAYRYDAASRGLILERAGNLSEWAMHLSLDQAFCAAAGAVIFFAADLGNLVQQCGDRIYRNLHLEAGLRAEAAYLVAHALGVGCTGIGAFYDLETVRFFNLPETTAIIYELAIGTPA